jgi:alpha-amylase
MPPLAVRRRPALAALLAGALLVSLGALPATSQPRDDGVARHSLRSPVTDETFYFVMADRFANGSTANDTAGLGDDPMVSGFDPTSKAFFNGGDLAGMLDRLDYIQGLGIDSVWLTPSFKNKPVQPEDGSAGYHGYWVTDFTQIDPHLGTNEELRALVDEAHARGMKVYFDIITNHTADVISYETANRLPYVSKDEVPYRTADGQAFDDRDVAGSDDFPALDPATSFPYTPVLAPGEEDLKVPAWLNDPTLYHNRGDSTFVGESSLYGDFVGLDDLFTEHPTVVEGMIDVYQAWIADFGIDGFRIDTMKHVDDAFWQRFGPEVLDFARAQGKDEFFMFGEVFDTSKPFLSHFTTRDRQQATIDFAFQAAARAYASGGGDAGALGEFFVADDWFTDADSNVYQLPTFLGNHDMGRIGHFIRADNPDADEDEWLARDRLAHELMFFSRGNPVVYYGDEQGFTGDGGDQDARQSMFASRVDDYLADDLLGTDRTHAQDNFDTSHVLYRTIAELSALADRHPALRDGAHQHRYASDGPGVYAFSRLLPDEQREYVVALNNSEQEQTAAVPTFVDSRSFLRVHGDGDHRVKSDGDGELTVTVPPLSTVVYRSAGRIPRSPAAPSITLGTPSPTDADQARMHVAADVAGDSFYEVTFQARAADGGWETIGTDDTAPYQVFDDVADLTTGTPLAYRAVVLDNGGHTRWSQVVQAAVPAPEVTLEVPRDGGFVSGDAVRVRAVVDPERASHVVALQRRVEDGDWTTLATDDSSPVYVAVDDVTGLAEGTAVSYRAVLTEASGNVVTSDVADVTVGRPPVTQPDTVSVPGSFNTEIGCPEDWMPSCAAAQLSLDPSDGLWKGTFDITPPGSYQYKIAHDGSWDVNYGVDGERDGGNISLSVPEDDTSVTFVYDPATHLVTTSTPPPPPPALESVSLPGSFNSEMGCADDWLPDCDEAQLTLDAADGLWKGTHDLPAGDWEYKVAHNRSWDVNYGADGVPDGGNILLSLEAASTVTFAYDPATHLVTTSVP